MTRESITPTLGRTSATSSTGAVASAVAGWALMAVVGLAVFVAVTILLLDHVVLPFDKPILAAVRPWAGDGTIWRIVSESANYPLIVIGIGMVLGLFIAGRRHEAIVVALMLIAITAGSEGVKQLVARPRPEGTDPNIPGVVYSYPSGHVLEALTIFGIIAIHVVRSRAPRWLATLIVIAVIVDAFLVGLARVVLNAHWPSDAIASVFAAVGVLGIYGLLTREGAWASRRHGQDAHRPDDGPERNSGPQRDSASAS